MTRESVSELPPAPTVAYRTALASVKLLKECSVLDLTEDDFDFLIQERLWLPVDRSRARRCVESVVYGTLDVVGFPRFAPPVEFVAAAIAIYVHPQNILSACIIMEGAEFTDNIINGVESPARAYLIFAHVLRILATDNVYIDARDRQIREDLAFKED